MAVQTIISKKRWLFSSLLVLMRVLFGVGWLLAGVTKITEKLWYKEPGVFLHDYLTSTLKNPNVPLFYKGFIENVALEYLMTLNYVIPIAQIILGVFMIMGFLTIPSILICLFMHINFILSGNMNVISLVLYTSAFTLIIFRTNTYYFSFDKYFNLKNQFATNKHKSGKNKSMLPEKERLFSNT